MFQRLIIIMLIMTGCAQHNDHIAVEDIMPELPNTVYQAGDCLYLIDPVSGKGRQTDAMKIEEVTATEYIYRWWVPRLNSNPPREEWAIGTNNRLHADFERITKRLNKCPG